MVLRRPALAGAAVVLLAACAAGPSRGASDAPGDGTRSTPRATPTAEPSRSAATSGGPAGSTDTALEDAVRAYSAAFLAGRGEDAHRLLSRRCRAAVPLSSFAAIADQAHALYGPTEIESLTVEVRGTKATATYAFADEALAQADEPWVDEDGWRNDDCPATP